MFSSKRQALESFEPYYTCGKSVRVHKSPHLNGIDLTEYKALPYKVDVVLVPICQGDNHFLPNWQVYYRLEQYEPDEDPVVVYYAPYWGEMWNVYRIVDNLYLCDTYVC